MPARNLGSDLSFHFLPQFQRVIDATRIFAVDAGSGIVDNMFFRRTCYT